MVDHSSSVHVFSNQLANSSKLNFKFCWKASPSNYFIIIFNLQYSAIDNSGHHLAITGRTGVAHYSLVTRKWKLFGNESQEKDFIVSGGLLWWRDYLVMGCYSIPDNGDEIRFYPKDCKLDNKFAKILRVSAPVLLINSLQDQLITFGSDAQVAIWNMHEVDAGRYLYTGCLIFYCPVSVR